MAYFEWVDDLVIDHGPIDQDHRHLVDLVNQPHTATSQGRGREVGFPRLEQHQIGHAHFIGQLEELKRQYEAGSITVASQLSSVLRDWLSLHIRRSDKEARAFVQKKSGG
jgi:hemerythrin